MGTRVLTWIGAAPGAPLWLIVALGALPFVIGGTLLAVAGNEPHRFGCQGPLANAPLSHLARCDRGATVAVSSSLLQYGHHPLYLIDGRIGGLHEKWMSQNPDPRPWVEIALPAPTMARWVRIHHAGRIEDKKFTTVDFDVLVRAAEDAPSTWRVAARVHDNRNAVTRHPLPAIPLTHVRIELIRPGQAGEKHARLVEVEVIEH